PPTPAPTLRCTTRAHIEDVGVGVGVGGVSLSGTSEAAPRRPRRGCQADAERRWPVRGPFQERSPKRSTTTSREPATGSRATDQPFVTYRETSTWTWLVDGRGRVF